LRGGRSEIGRQVALTHTGSIAGSDAITEAVLGQAGVELVERSDELALVAGAMARTAPVDAARNVVIVSDGGGHATLAADALDALGVELAELSDQTMAALRECVGEPATVGNPIDVAGATDSDPARFADVVEIVMNDPSAGLVLIVGLFGGYHLRFDPSLREEEDRVAERLLNLTDTYGIPLLVQSCYAVDQVANHDRLRSGGVTVLSSIDHAVRVVAALDRRGRHLATLDQRSDFVVPALVPGAHGAFARPLDEPSARRLVEKHGISTGTWRLAASTDDVVAAVSELGVPCALKVVSARALHKSDVGGVRLDVTGSNAEQEAEGIVDSVTRHLPHADIEGIVVSPMAARGTELLVGATRDPTFGPVVAFGAGGVAVEAVNDVAFRAAPLTMTEAREMIAETRIAALLRGYRDVGAVDLSSVAEMLVRVGGLIVNDTSVEAIDLNPVIATSDSITPVDVRVVRLEASGRAEALGHDDDRHRESR